MNRAYAKAFAPFVDPKRVADGDLYVDRDDSPRQAFLEATVLDDPTHCLLIGATGSGKSTELLRLAREVARYDDPPVVAFIRLQDQCSPEALTPAQVLFLIGVMALRLIEPVGVPPAKLVDELRDAYLQIVTPPQGAQVDVADLAGRLALYLAGPASKADPTTGLVLGAGGSLLKAVKKAPTIALPGRGRTLAANDPAITRLAESVDACIERARSTYAEAPLMLFVDGLDKLDMLHSGAMFGSDILARPVCTVIYTAPISLRYNLVGTMSDPWFKTLTLGNFRVFSHRNDGRRDPTGFLAMRRLISRRIESAGLNAEQVFESGLEPGGLVDRLIEASGGITRVFILMCDAALRRGLIGTNIEHETLTEVEVESVIRDFEQRTVTRLKPEHYEPLLGCWETHARPGGDHGEELLFTNLVHCYANEWPWYRPTPLVLRFLKERFPDRGPRDAAS
ncbi:MAG: hypothetical protein AAGF11_32285 [Myxococcota bacterium]